MKSNDMTRCRILVVDADRDALAATAELFRPYGCTLTVASTAGDAVTQAELFLPHAVYMGLEFEDCDGWELASRLRRIPGMSKAVLVGLLVCEDEWRPCDSIGSHGFDYYFPKPPRMADIVAALTKELPRALLPLRPNVPKF